MKLALRQPYRQFFGTLANQVRLDILEQLTHGPQTVTALTSALTHTQPTISKSLSRLLTCGFVSVEQDGRERTYTLNKRTIAPLFDLMHHHMHHHCRHVVNTELAHSKPKVHTLRKRARLRPQSNKLKRGQA